MEEPRPLSPRLIAGLSSSASAGPIGCTSGRDALEFGAFDFGAFAGFFGVSGFFAMAGIWDGSALEEEPPSQRMAAAASRAISIVRGAIRHRELWNIFSLDRAGARSAYGCSLLSGLQNLSTMPRRIICCVKELQWLLRSIRSPARPADPSMLANIPRLVTAYFAGKPDPSVPSQRVAFGTSGHRGSAFNNAFNEAHILAISQAMCDHRQQRRHHRSAVRRHRHPRAGGAGAGERARSVRGQRRRGDDRRARRLYADAGDFARDPHLQQGPRTAASPTAS